MTIPTYEQFMYPFLEYLGDEKEHTLKELYDYLPKYFQLTDEQIQQLLPSGKQSIVVNRIGWARTYLKNAGLINSPKRAVFQITERGKSVLKDESIHEINESILKRFPEFMTFKYGKTNENESSSNSEADSSTPLEIIEQNFALLKHSVQHDLLNKIMECSPSFFEQLIVELLVAMGYGGSIKDAGQAVGKSGDGGIDGIIKEDVLGLDKIYLQGKRWSNPVSRPDIQAFVGSLLGVKANKGVFITTSRFTKEAIEYAQNVDRSLILIDGEKLTDLMFEYNVGVSNETVLTLKKIDLDYFEEN